MPYINTTTTVKLTEKNKDSLKAKLGEIIAEIPGKSEEWLMVGFKDDNTLYFRGEKEERAAFVDVRIFGTALREHKEKVVSKICSLLKEELSIEKDKIYITFEEVKDWGWNGEMF